MIYNFTNLTSRADCQFLIQEVEKQKRSLTHKLEALRMKDISAEGRSEARDAEILRLSTELVAVETIIAQLPDGKTKNTFLAKREDIQYKLARLNRQRASNGVTADVERDYDIGSVEAQVAVADDFIAGITTHMNAIPE